MRSRAVSWVRPGVGGVDCLLIICDGTAEQKLTPGSQWPRPEVEDFGRVARLTAAASGAGVFGGRGHPPAPGSANSRRTRAPARCEPSCSTGPGRPPNCRTRRRIGHTSGAAPLTAVGKSWPSTGNPNSSSIPAPAVFAVWMVTSRHSSAVKASKVFGSPSGTGTRRSISTKRTQMALLRRAHRLMRSNRRQSTHRSTCNLGAKGYIHAKSGPAAGFT
mmetsp:Transcript_7612/g.22446  ORF Transcript_7612/g.22446 Transcript_7612/m.22446 type:complete len:218 (+) Transcript_7612:2175-2828(+)